MAGPAPWFLNLRSLYRKCDASHKVWKNGDFREDVGVNPGWLWRRRHSGQTTDKGNFEFLILNF
jgi:hypothetical protein